MLHASSSLEQSLNVRDHGVVGDGNTDDLPALQRLVDQHRRVMLPFGTYKLGGTLHLPSGTRLQAHPYAKIILADGAASDQSHFLLTNHNSFGPTGSDSGTQDSDIQVIGGVWDGNSAGNKRGEDRTKQYSGVLMHFGHVNNLVLRDLAVRNSESYYIRLGWTKQFHVARVRIENTRTRPNQDGVHVSGCCADGLIEDIHAHGLATPNDDMVALNADDAIWRIECNGALCGPIRRIRVRGLRADDCHSFVRMASVDHEIEDITVEDVQGGCQICAVNADALRYCRTPIFKNTDPGRENGVGGLRRIHLSRFNVWSTANNKAALFRLESRMPSLTMEHITRDLTRDAAPSRPTLRICYAPGQLMMNQPGQLPTHHSVNATDPFETHAAAIEQLTFIGA